MRQRGIWGVTATAVGGILLLTLHAPRRAAATGSGTVLLCTHGSTECPPVTPGILVAAILPFVLVIYVSLCAVAVYKYKDDVNAALESCTAVCCCSCRWPARRGARDDRPAAAPLVPNPVHAVRLGSLVAGRGRDALTGPAGGGAIAHATPVPSMRRLPQSSVPSRTRMVVEPEPTGATAPDSAADEGGSDVHPRRPVAPPPRTGSRGRARPPADGSAAPMVNNPLPISRHGGSGLELPTVARGERGSVVTANPAGAAATSLRTPSSSASTATSTRRMLLTGVAGAGARAGASSPASGAHRTHSSSAMSSSRTPAISGALRTGSSRPALTGSAAAAARSAASLSSFTAAATRGGSGGGGAGGGGPPRTASLRTSSARSGVAAAPATTSPPSAAAAAVAAAAAPTAAPTSPPRSSHNLDTDMLHSHLAATLAAARLARGASGGRPAAAARPDT